MTNKDEEILSQARAIQEATGKSLIDAMILAEEKLTPKAEVPSEFTVTIPVKARVARWIVEEFAATPTHSTEERLAAYLITVLNRARMTSIRMAEEAPDIGEGGAVTLRRADFQRKAGA